jgi:hypothetical protein
MARLHAYGGDNGTKAVNEFDSVDLQALQLAHAWGVNGNGHTEYRWTFSPCPRPGCGGAIVSGWNDACILCAHSGSTLIPNEVPNGYRP